MSDCIFCHIIKESELKMGKADRIVEENTRFIAMRDGFPVTEGHTLIIPKSHKETFFDLDAADMISLHDMINRQKVALEEDDPTIKGFNIGMNCGETAGQTVFHCHIHLIPRRDGDVENPRGGVRHLIPGKGNY